MIDEQGVWHDNVRCPVCRYRHPAAWSCEHAAAVAAMYRPKEPPPSKLATRRIGTFFAQAAQAERMAKEMWDGLLAEGFVEEYPGVLIKRDDEGGVSMIVET
jgi:hypothetical protein